MSMNNRIISERVQLRHEKNFIKRQIAKLKKLERQRLEVLQLRNRLEELTYESSNKSIYKKT